MGVGAASNIGIGGSCILSCKGDEQDQDHEPAALYFGGASPLGGTSTEVNARGESGSDQAHDCENEFELSEDEANPENWVPEPGFQVLTSGIQPLATAGDHQHQHHGQLHPSSNGGGADYSGHQLIASDPSASVDLPQGFPPRKRKSEDLISLLVSIYGSPECFVREYREILAERVLAKPPLMAGGVLELATRERQNLELLKTRFGEPALQTAEVMLSDL